MRLVSFHVGGTPSFGVVLNDKVATLTGLGGGVPHSMAAFLAAGEAGRKAAQKAVDAISPNDLLDLDALDFDVPVPEAGKILCLGLNFAKHAAEGGSPPPDFPIVFVRTQTSLVAHNHDMIAPKMSHKLDYEAELVVVIGREAHHVSEADGLDYVAGYSCFNDGSVRDYQKMTTQWTLGKNFDRTGGFGPVMVSADEVPPGCAGLAIRSRLNGEVMQDDNISSMIFPVAKTIHILSECLTLNVGDVIVMGTCAGVGFARTPPVWMKAGDRIEIEIEQVGTLVNMIVDE